MLGKSLRKGNFNYLVEKIVSKLARWKAYALSLVGCMTLAKSVIQAILVYPMMTMPIDVSLFSLISKPFLSPF